MDYEVVIGLETHAQLNTSSKLFCGCSMIFGAPPNSQTCPVCIGMPGVLPVMNKAAVEKVARIALAMHCTIDRSTYMDRKSYYYPDLPKNYQISQSHSNLGSDGYVDIQFNGETKRIGIDNVHLEEDAGKLIHPEGRNVAYTMVDLNRTGTPLAEIVTRPDMRSIDEAHAYMEQLQSMLLYLDASDCKMQEGSLRFEASISLRPRGQKEYGSRVEIKNLNSMKAVVKSLEYEVQRQTQVLSGGGTVYQETRLWDDIAGGTALMRRKETAQDYRYFPEPDLHTIHISDEWLEVIRASLPELAHERRRRFIETYKLPEYDAGVLVVDKGVADYFEKAASIVGDPKAAANFLMTEVLRELKERKTDIGSFSVSPERVAELLILVKDAVISYNIAKEVFIAMIETGRPAGVIVEQKGLKQISDTSELEAVITQALDENPAAVSDLKQGKKQALGFLVGQIMRKTKGKANPQVIHKILSEKMGI